MQRPFPSRSIAIIAMLGGALGCRASDAAPPAAAADAEPAPAPIVASTEPTADALPPASSLVADHDSPWAYLVARYDADADGRISFDEHGRGPESFDRLDRNGDGVLSLADFDASSPSQEPSIMAMLMFGRYFQDDDDPLTLDLDELDESITLIDDDGDDRVSRQELTAVLGERARAGVPLEGMLARMVDRRDPWQTLVGSIDADDDGALTRSELVSFFESEDDSGEGR